MKTMLCSRIVDYEFGKEVPPFQNISDVNQGQVLNVRTLCPILTCTLRSVNHSTRTRSRTSDVAISAEDVCE